jgi:hypothetical protein
LRFSKYNNLLLKDIFVTKKIPECLSLIVNVIGLFGFIFNFLVWCNWIPGYEFKKLLANSVYPQVYLFPAQQIRLSPSFVDKAQNSQVERAHWSLKKYNIVAYQADGLEPTFTIPPSEGGIYQLEVKLKLLDEDKERSGRTNIYVVQDKPEKIKTASKATIKKGMSGLSDELLKAVQVHGGEVYEGSMKWKTIDSSQIGPASITIPENTELASFKGQAIIRAKGSGKNLLDYGTFPTALKDVPVIQGAELKK